MLHAKSRYDAVAIAIHWLTAAAIAGQLVMGWTMTAIRPGAYLQFSLYQWHKSVGMTILALSVLRLVWRVMDHRPAVTRCDACLGAAPCAFQPCRALRSAYRVTAVGLGCRICFTSQHSNRAVWYCGAPASACIAGSRRQEGSGGCTEERPSFRRVGLRRLACRTHRRSIASSLPAARRRADEDAAAHRDARLRSSGGRMRSSIVAACALVAVALPNAACATEWSVDTAKSWLGFTGIMAKAPFNGRFGHWRADISFDPSSAGGWPCRR